MVTGSIVLYKNDKNEVISLIENCIKYGSLNYLYLIDNSPESFSQDILNQFSPNVIYVHNSSNLGFGAGHNIAMQRAMSSNSLYHFVINPDIFFNSDIITPMVKYMSADSTIGMMMPQVLSMDGSIQFLPKLLPTPLTILIRKIRFPKSFAQKVISNYELRQIQSDLTYNTPVLSGCFTLLNLKIIKEIGGYDDRFFMYFEDWDLSRRIHQKYRTLYFPNVSVYHGYESGANRSFKLFKIFINSAIKYFNKWGWFLDKQRSLINKKALENIC